MKLLITPYCELLSDLASDNVQNKGVQFFNALKTASDNQAGLTIDMHNNQLDRSQIDSVLDKLDITNMLNPNMLNTGGMEVLATIRQDLSHTLETLLAAQNN